MICFALSLSVYAQSIYKSINYDTVKAQRFDMGKMWTFENPPKQYFADEYGFTPTDEWLEKVRKSALKFANWCSASFVSEDGLIMTNHHCARENLTSVQKPGENLLRDGFLAKSLDEERRMPGIYVNQLIHIEDVTTKVLSEMEKVTGNKEKIDAKEEIIRVLTKEASERNPGLHFEVVSLYNGGRYSLYGYKKYDDVRLVFSPDLRTAKLGGDFDNFTYPRYGLDCTFFRVYDENGKPIKCEYYFKWSISGAKEGEPVFVVGNPGRTSRLSTISQITFARDFTYPLMVDALREVYDLYYTKVMDGNEEDYVLVSKLYSIGNGLKVYNGTLKGLQDDYLIARKYAFEKEFKAKISSNPKLKEKYLYIWDEINNSRKQAKEFTKELFALTLNPRFSSEYFSIARELLQIADELKKPEEERGEKFKKDNLETTIRKVFKKDFDKDFADKMLLINISMLRNLLGIESPYLKTLLKESTNDNFANHILGQLKLNDHDFVVKSLMKGYDEFTKINDPVIQFIKDSKKRLSELRELNSKITEREAILNQELGKAAWEVYGDAIPPDATFTLRIADGVLKHYDYNGTIAPVKTTFYGVLDRYYGFDKKFPFNLPPIWENLPKEFDLYTPLNFISTCDIVGGNSGSAVINRNAEIVGLAFDGNIESLPSNFIFTTEANRTVNVHNEGMIEAIRDLYKLNRLADELINGQIKE